MARFLQPNRTEPLADIHRPQVEGRATAFRLTPLLAALLLAYPVMQAQLAQAEDTPNTKDALPDLGRASERPSTFSVSPNGATLDNRFDGKRILISPEYSDQTGLSVGGAFAFPLGDSAAGGLLATAGAKKKELLFNAGFQMGEVQRLVLTLGQLRQHLDIGFASGSEKTEMTQNSGAVSYQRFLGTGLLNFFEINGYLADTPSRDLADKTYAIDTATLYELWNDPRRVGGGRVTGLQGRLAFTPLPGSTLKLGAGGERLEYDYLTGKQSTTRGTGSAEWSQRLAAGLNLKAGLDGAAAQNRFTLGVEKTYSDGWKFGINATAIQGRDGAPNDSRLNLAWSYDFGGKGSGVAATTMGCVDLMTGTPVAGSSTPVRPGNTVPAWGSLLDQVAKRPSFLPAQVVAKLDTTATPTRLIAVNKAALPAGASINNATGVITSPLGVVVTSIAGITKNGGAFTNSGQFALSGNSLIIDPNQITQPAVGVTDTYVVTVNNQGGGTTLVTVVVSHGSVKIDSVTINGNTAPSASNVSISGTATVGQVLTGHYTYADANGDPQGTSTFRWLRNGAAIAGATASTYTLVADDYGKAISFEVTPVATVAPTTGAAVTSGATTVNALPADYVFQGGLIWTPNTIGSATFGGDFKNLGLLGGYTVWNTANTYCSTATILGQTGWRLPTSAELSALSTSGAIIGHNWVLYGIWSSTPHGTGYHEAVDSANGVVGWSSDTDLTITYWVTCVR